MESVRTFNHRIFHFNKKCKRCGFKFADGEKIVSLLGRRGTSKAYHIECFVDGKGNPIYDI